MNKFKLTLVMAILPISVFAATQKKQSTTFNISKEWKCEQSDKVYTCNILGEDQKIEAQIMLIAKEKNDKEALTDYYKKFKDKKHDTKIVPIQGRMWVDSQNHASEVPNYITRDMVTIINNKVVLLSFNAHKAIFDQYYESDFMTVINTVKVGN